MKKTLLLSILWLVSFAMTAWPQNLMLGQEEPENKIEVVGYFCKNDTMTYRQTHGKYIIQENDTTVSETVSEQYVEEFMIVVTDSTSNGYKMKSIPLSFTYHDADMSAGLKENAMGQLMQSVVCEFTTDEYGSIKSITNWREISDQLKKGVKSTCDSLYSTIPGLDSIMPRESLETWLLFNSSAEREEDICQLYEVLENLFGLHGSSFEICDEEEDTKEQGSSRHTLIQIGYIPIESEHYDHDGDYELLTQSTATTSVEDFKASLGALSTIVSEYLAYESNVGLEAYFDQMVDSMKTANPNGAVSMLTEHHTFFVNGWPKEYYHEKAADLGFVQSIEVKYIRCISGYMRF